MRKTPNPEIKVKKLKIGLVFDDSLDRPDGVQQYVQRVAEYLTAKGHEVHFLVGETLRKDLRNVHTLSRNLRVKFNGNTMSMPLPGSKRALNKVLQDNKFDILHVQVPYSPFMAGRIIKLATTETAVIGTFHILPYSKLVVFGNWFLAFVNLRSGRRFDAMMAASPPAKTFAQKLYNYDCEVVPNPIRVSDFTAPASSKKNSVPRIVFLGRLVERKGARHLLEAVAYMLQNHLYDGRFEVIVGGKGELQNQLREFVHHAGLREVVTFTGFIPETDKALLLASADLAVFPSISGESFGISLLEAMAAARGVVLAGDNPGYASVMHGLSNRLINPEDISKFAHALADWLGDAEARAVAAAEQHEYVKQFDIAFVGAQIEAVYNRALSVRQNSPL